MTLQTANQSENLKGTTLCLLLFDLNKLCPPHRVENIASVFLLLWWTDKTCHSRLKCGGNGAGVQCWVKQTMQEVAWPR